MAINKKLIHFKTKQKFNEELANGNILETSIVFILDTTEIYTHGLLYDGSKVDLSKLEEAISKIKTDGDGLMYLNDKGEYEIPLIIVDSEEELNSITPEIGTRAVVRTVVKGYDNLNLAKILNGEETNVPADMFNALDKYAFKVTSVDTSILFPYLEDDEHTIYELFTLLNSFEEFEMVTNLDGSSIARVLINSFGVPSAIYNGYGYDFYWHDNNIVERIITIDNIMGITNLGQNVVDAFLLFSTALNGSIIANNDYIDYHYTSKGWVLNDYVTILLLYLFLYDISNIVTEQTPTRVSQLVNDSNYILDDVISDGVYAVDTNGKLINYNTADSSCLGVALVKGEHKFMIAKADATDGTNTTLYWGKNLHSKDVAGVVTNGKVDGTNSSGYLPKPDGTFGGSTHLSDDFTTWTNGALSDFNGKANTAAIIAGYTEHGVSMDARDMCTVLDTFNASDSHNDWYVPALGQLALMYLNKTEINAALAKIGGTALAAERYWSSSERTSFYAWYVSFSSGFVDNSTKDNNLRLRFVRNISVSKPLKERVLDLENNKADKSDVEVEVEVENGVYAITADGKLIDYNLADATATGVALVAGEHKFMIAKADATDGTNTTLYWGKNLKGKDVAGITLITNNSVAKADFNGKANTDAIKAAYSQHSVDMNSRDMCKVLSTYAEGGFTDWYVPAAGQLYEMYTNKTEINAALAKIGGTAFKSNYYWSSSEYGAANAWLVTFNDGYVSYDGKDYNERVRFIRDLATTTIKKPLKEKVSEIESSVSELELNYFKWSKLELLKNRGSLSLVLSAAASPDAIPYTLSINFEYPVESDITINHTYTDPFGSYRGDGTLVCKKGETSASTICYGTEDISDFDFVFNSFSPTEDDVYKYEITFG